LQKNSAKGCLASFEAFCENRRIQVMSARKFIAVLSSAGGNRQRPRCILPASTSSTAARRQLGALRSNPFGRSGSGENSAERCVNILWFAMPYSNPDLSADWFFGVAKIFERNVSRLASYG
jgi:hypothetical protein